MTVYTVITLHDEKSTTWGTFDTLPALKDFCQYLVDNTNNPAAFIILRGVSTPAGVNITRYNLTEFCAAQGIKKRSFYEKLNS